MSSTRLWHGGVPDLKPGDLIEPGHQRKSHDGCPWCAARDEGGAHLGIDPPSERADQVYLTPIREYARFHASLYGRGDLYRVEPVGDVERSTEDTIETWTAPTARVVAVVERYVLLTPGQRRQINRIWTAADAEAVEEK